MAKVKSIKFYNFVEVSGGLSTTLNVRFYNMNGKLILIDFSNPTQTPTSTYCENSEYIVTSYSGGRFYGEKTYPHQAFHIGNKNLNVNIPPIGYTWVPVSQIATSNDFVKIEFKFPQYISKVEILYSYAHTEAIDTMDYDIEFNDGIIKTHNFKSNGIFSTIDTYTMEHFLWNQDTLDSYFSELEFDKSKQIYDSKSGYVETLDTNNFRNVQINTIGNLKVLYERPVDTYLNCLISFDKKNTWKVFNGDIWNEISDTSANNIVLNGMDIEKLNQLDRNKLISGGFTGDLDFKIAMKTNDVNKTPSVTKIYIEYK